MKRVEAAMEEMGLHPLWRLRREKAIEPPGEPVAMGWEEMKSAIESCTACSLHKGRNRTVVGAGCERADWLFIGEAPGAEEDLRGEPFVGQAGVLLDNMLASIGLSREKNVYIANTVKCRPPGNRNPEPSEMAACRPFLSRQIELVGPRLIVLLGRIAVQSILGSDASISSLRGKVHACGNIPAVVTYHPAYLLRNPMDKSKAWEDLCFARKIMNGL